VRSPLSIIAAGPMSTPALPCAKSHVSLDTTGHSLELTCPPEKPTATTPSSWPFVKNFCSIIEVVSLILTVCWASGKLLLTAECERMLVAKYLRAG
jgi:hypothetical protein